MPPQPGSLGNNRMVMAAIGLAVAFLAFWLFSGEGSGGMVISVSGPGGTAVEGVTVSLDGEEVCETSTCKIADLTPGSYVVKATAEGYADMAGTAYSIESDEQKAINIELVAGTGGTGLKVTSDSPGLTLSVDGKKIGALPQELTDIEPGEHKLSLSGSPFFDDYSETVTIKKGETLEFEPKLTLAKGQVNIKLDQSARGAKIALLVNGKRRSLTSRFGADGEKSVKIDLPVEGKSYKVRAIKKGYSKFQKELTFTLEEPVQTVTISLEEESERDNSSRRQARTTPRRSTGGRAAPAPAPAPKPKPTAAKGQGKVNINSIPKSNVILDGRPIGSTPKIGYSVSAGSHTVVFVHPTHGRKVKRVSVPSGGVGTAAVRFP